MQVDWLPYKRKKMKRRSWVRGNMIPCCIKLLVERHKLKHHKDLRMNLVLSEELHHLHLFL